MIYYNSRLSKSNWIIVDGKVVQGGLVITRFEVVCPITLRDKLDSVVYIYLAQQQTKCMAKIQL